MKIQLSIIALVSGLLFSISTSFAQTKNDIDYSFYYGQRFEEGGKSNSNSVYGVAVGTSLFENTTYINLSMDIKNGYVRNVVLFPDSPSVRQDVSMSSVMVSIGPSISSKRSNFFSGVIVGLQGGLGIDTAKTYPPIAGVYIQMNLSWPKDITLGSGDKGKYTAGLAVKPVFNFVFDENEDKPIFSPNLQIAARFTIRGKEKETLISF